jgi:hypothetical protein
MKLNHSKTIQAMRNLILFLFHESDVTIEIQYVIYNIIQLKINIKNKKRRKITSLTCDVQTVQF